MSLNRITNGYLLNQSVNSLNLNLNSLNTLQKQLSTGQNINQPSDDPIGTTQLLSLTNALNDDARYSSNIDDANTEVNTADTALSSMVDIIQRIQELTTQAANATNNQSGRDAIADEVNQDIDQLVQLGNTDIGGKYIFGGFQTDQPPFVRTDDYIVQYNGTPPADNWQRPTEVSQGVTMDININGENLLGSAAGPAGAAPPSPLPANIPGSGLFQTLTELLSDLRSGNDPSQLSEIKNRLDDLTTQLNTVSSQQSIIGAISNRLQLTQNRISDRKTVLTQQFDDIQNVDMPATIAALNSQENTFQSSLSVTARVLQTSLLDYLTNA